GEARRRQEAPQRRDIIAVEAKPVGQLEPARDTAFALAVAVVIGEAAPPRAACRRILAARDQARVLDRDHRLIIVTVEGPGLHLAFAASAAMQELVERVQPMIAPRAEVAQTGFELLRTQRIQ